MAPTTDTELEAPYLTVGRQRACPFDPPTVFVEAACRGDIVDIPFHGGHHGWLVTGHELAKTILADRRFSVRPDLAEGAGAQRLRSYVAPGLFHQVDAPEHTRLRGTVTGEFTPARMEALRPAIARLATGCLDDLEEAGPGADLMRHVGYPFPLLVIAEFLGIPEELRDFFVQHAIEVVTKEKPDDERASALTQIIDLTRPLLQMREDNPQDDLLTRLTDREGTDLDEAAGIAAQVLVAGAMVPASMLGFGLYALLQSGGLAAFAGPEEEVANRVEELLRYLSFEAQPRIRVALDDVEVGGVHVRRGQLVAVAIDVANRDPRAFEDPDTLRFDRTPATHLAFGWGAHQCLGQNLARIELATVLHALADRFPSLALVDGAGDLPIAEEGIARTVAQMPVRW